MKVFQILLLAGAAVLGVSADVTRQVYHVTAPKSVLDATLARHGSELDVWKVERFGADKLKAEVYATEQEIALFQKNTNSRFHFFANETLIVRDPVNTAQLLETSAAITATCATTSRRNLQTTTTKYVDNAFFDCFRQASEVYAFFDQMVTENPTIFSKVARVATTYQGRAVPAYKISTGAGRKPLYTQGLIHAREWIAGSSTFYVMSALVDGLRANNTNVVNIFKNYDWYFVPILNVDGYIYSWSSSSARLWRKNRRLISGSTYGVDLNRNYPPASYWGLGGGAASSDVYPGTGPLSEPETSGSFAYIKSLGIWGAIDMHSYAGEILRAYGNRAGTPPAPYGPKLKVLGDAMAAAAGSGYVSKLSAELYIAYGCFDDAVFQELNKPTFTIEMAGTSFIASETTIRSAGLKMFNAFVAFGQGMPTYWSGLV